MSSHRSQNYAVRPTDDGLTYRVTFRNLGFKDLANLTGWTAFGAFVDVETGARTYDSLAGTINSFSQTDGSADVSIASPTAPMTAAKYRLEITMVNPSGKKISGPSPEQDQIFIDVRSTG